MEANAAEGTSSGSANESEDSEVFGRSSMESSAVFESLGFTAIAVPVDSRGRVWKKWSEFPAWSMQMDKLSPWFKNPDCFIRTFPPSPVYIRRSFPEATSRVLSRLYPEYCGNVSFTGSSRFSSVLSDLSFDALDLREEVRDDDLRTFVFEFVRDEEREFLPLPPLSDFRDDFLRFKSDSDAAFAFSIACAFSDPGSIKLVSSTVGS